jgi:hypothetical protein
MAVIRTRDRLAKIALDAHFALQRTRLAPAPSGMLPLRANSMIYPCRAMTGSLSDVGRRIGSNAEIETR